MNQTRMESRRAHFKIGNIGHQTSQEKRRLEHLQLQRQRRSNAFDSIRGIEDLANCFLDDQSVEEEGSESSEGRYEDAIEEEAEEKGPNELNLKDNHQNLNSIRDKIYHKYLKYRDRCMRAEFLELSEGLPNDFDQDWVLLGPVPKGKRCLAITLSNDKNRSNFNVNSISNMVTLLSRKSANKIGTFLTILPVNCMLDCIYDDLNQTLWILDVLKWKNQAMIDCEAHFRFWWRNAKLSELETQSLPDSRTLLCAPIPVLFNFTKSHVAKLTREILTSSRVIHQMRVLCNQDQIPRKVLHNINYECEGLLFYIKSATYESGESVLAGWVPLDVTDEKSNDHGIAKLNWLCERELNTMEE